MAKIRVKRGTRAALDAAAVAEALAAGEPYLITDEGRLAVGTSAGAYAGMLRQRETLIEQPEYNIGSLGATPTINPANGNRQRGTLNATATITLSTPAHPTHVRLRLLNSGAGHAIVWATTVRWVGGSAPDFDDADAAENVISLDYGATGWIGDGGAL